MKTYTTTRIKTARTLSCSPSVRYLIASLFFLTALVWAALPARAATPTPDLAPPARTITTYAGGPGHGPATLFGQCPSYVAIRGRLVYTSDFCNAVVRGLDKTTGNQTVVAGNLAPGFSGDGGPATKASLGVFLAGVAVDSAGNLYIADPGAINSPEGGDRIRKVDTKGIITTVAGNGTGGYSGDGGPATSAQLYDPRDVAVDSDGNFYIADSLNGVIRKVDASGIITTVANLAFI